MANILMIKSINIQKSTQKIFINLYNKLLNTVPKKTMLMVKKKT